MNSPFRLFDFVVLPFCTVFVDLEGIVEPSDVTSRAAKKLESLNKRVDKIRGRLENPSFLSNAPEKVVEEAASKWLDLLSQRNRTLNYLVSLAGN